MRVSEGLYRIGRHSSAVIKGIKGALALSGICEDVMTEPFQRFHEPERARVRADSRRDRAAGGGVCKGVRTMTSVYARVTSFLPHVAIVASLGLCLASAAPPIAAQVETPTHRDVVYASVDGKPLAPRSLHAGRRDAPPLLVWVHGGAWRRAAKANPPLAFVRAASRSRASTSGCRPRRVSAQVHDIKAAIRFLRATRRDVRLSRRADRDRRRLVGRASRGARGRDQRRARARRARSASI